MSRTEIYAVAPETGDVELEAEISNSWRGAMLIWTTLAEKYGITNPGEGHMLMLREPLLQQLWGLSVDDRLAWWERVILLTTFDRVVILRDDFGRLIEACEQWSANVGDAGSIPEQGGCFRLIEHHERPFRGICFNQTTVSQSHWWRYADGDDEGRPYNVDVDTDWWSLFDAYPVLRAAIPVT